MNSKDWDLLLALSNEGTIRKAPQKLYISQPALTLSNKTTRIGFLTLKLFQEDIKV